MTTMTADEVYEHALALKPDERKSLANMLKIEITDRENELLTQSLGQAALGEFVSRDELLDDMRARRGQ